MAQKKWEKVLSETNKEGKVMVYDQSEGRIIMKSPRHRDSVGLLRLGPSFRLIPGKPRTLTPPRSLITGFLEMAWSMASFFSHP